MNHGLRPLPRASFSPMRLFRSGRLAFLEDFAQSLGPERVGTVRFGTRLLVLVNDPGLVGDVLLGREADFRKGPALSVYSRPLLGDGLLTSEGAFHRRQRRLVTPAFTPRRLASYADAFAASAEETQAAWRDGQTIDAADAMTRLTLRVVGKTLFDAEHVTGEAEELGDALTILMRWLMRTLDTPVRLPFAWIPPWRWDVRDALARLDVTVYRLIHDRRASGEDTGDLLSMLLLARDAETGEAMDDRQTRDEVMTLFLAGHETTANALAWTWHLLTSHPDIYRRVQQEADDTLGGRTPTYDDLPRLPYTLQVLKESMRLYPPAYVLVRQALCDTSIGPFRVPARAVVLISAYLLHRDPHHFPEPERFDPDRFAPDAERTLPRNAYLPFGGGPRVCIGAAFALTEAHLILATLAQRVTFERPPGSAPKVEMEPLMTLRPKGGIPLLVRKRDTNR
jgi:cytochrome P450